MIGLPYPNPSDPELVEKIKFLNTKSPTAGRDFYENLCMKAVNQSIGRAIRHRQDYASIILIDHRYSTSRIQSRLPSWIQERVLPSASFGVTYARLGEFFRQKRQ
jgi:chromosome transmission fidelity protein 1